MIASSVVRTAVATAAGAAVAWFVLGWARGLDLSGLGVTGTRAVHVFGPLIGGLLVYWVAAWLLRMDETRWLLAGQRPAGRDEVGGGC